MITHSFSRVFVYLYQYTKIIILFKYASLFHPDPLLISRYLQSSHNDIEKAKALLLLSFNMRNQYPEIFFNRDPLSAQSKAVISMTYE